MSMFILGLVALSGAVQTVVATDEPACLRAAHSVAQTASAAGLAQVSCVEAVRQHDGKLAWTGKPVRIVWRHPHAVMATPPAGPQCGAFAALADPRGCMPYEQQRIDIERERLSQTYRLDIRVEP